MPPSPPGERRGEGAESATKGEAAPAGTSYRIEFMDAIIDPAASGTFLPHSGTATQTRSANDTDSSSGGTFAFAFTAQTPIDRTVVHAPSS